MNDFNIYLKKLPNTLDQSEQGVLFYELSKLKSEYENTHDVSLLDKIDELRCLICNHNLRLCAFVAKEYCMKYNRLKDMEDINSECVIALQKAIDDYDLEKNVSFGVFAHKYMSTYLLNKYLKSLYDVSTYLNDETVYDKHHDEIIDESSENFLDRESDFVDDIIQEEFIDDILQMIDSIKPQRHAEIFKLYKGIGCDRKYSQKEIAEKYKYTPVGVCKIIKKVTTMVADYLIENYPELSLDYKKIVTKKRFAFKDSVERDEYIYNALYGIGMKQKSKEEIACEVGILPNYVDICVIRHEKKVEEDKRISSTVKVSSRVELNDEQNKQIFEMYFGLGGYSIHSPKEIVKLLNLKFESVFTRGMRKYIMRLIGDGVYSLEEIENFKKSRQKRIKEESLLKNYPIYASFKGHNCEKLTFLQLSKIYGMSVSQLQKKVYELEKYLERLDTEDREKFFAMADEKYM